MVKFLFINSIIVFLFTLIIVSKRFFKNQDFYNSSKYLKAITGVPILYLLAVVLFLFLENNLNFLSICLIAIIDISIVVFIFVILLLSTSIKNYNQIVISGNNKISLNSKRKKIYIGITIVLPIICLSLNNQGAIQFGDFSNPFFYIIALLNGSLFLIPYYENSKLRIILFYLKSVGLTYIVYFFIVFLPLLPFGLLGIIFLGLGLLLFTPSAILYLQGIHLFREFKGLTNYYNKSKVVLAFIAGIITLPILFTANTLIDKINFDNAIVYLDFEPNYNKNINIKRLQNTVDTVANLYNSNNFFSSLGYRKETPILSNIYSKIVCNNKVISNETLNNINKIFFDYSLNYGTQEGITAYAVNDTINIEDIAINTKLDSNINAYRTWIDLSLKNNSDITNAEFITSFKLPKFTYITDYYLYVMGEKINGTLVDKRAATTLYNKIVAKMQDPGLIRYINSDTIELRVYPFLANEIRKTGFEIIHKEPFGLNLNEINLEVNCKPLDYQTEFEFGQIVTKDMKQNLKSIKREQQYYFVIDSSENSNVEQSIELVKDYTAKNNIDNADIIFTTYKLNRCKLNEINNIKYKTECGFNLNLAFKNILQSETDVPIIIVVSDNIAKSLSPLKDYSYNYPESQYYYQLNYNLTLKPYYYKDNQVVNELSELDKPIIENALIYKDKYIKNNNQHELIITNENYNNFDIDSNQFTSAIKLDALSKLTVSTNEDLINLVKLSFRAKVLNNYTAFMVVETDEQQRQLLELQEKLLNNTNDTTIIMNEPSLIILIILVFIIIYKSKKSNKI